MPSRTFKQETTKMSSSASKRKRKSHKKNAPAMPLLPPEATEDEIEISDEDIEYVSKHKKYAGFLSSLNTANITKQVLGIKPAKKEDANLEAYYERKASRMSALKHEDDRRGNFVDSVDVLPIKTLSGELQYRSDQSKAQPESEDKPPLSMEERKQLVKQKCQSKTSQVPTPSGEKAINTEEVKKVDTKKEKKKDKKTKQQSSVDGTSKGSHVLALEELKKDISEEERVEEVKARMAELGTSVLGDPENNMESLVQLQELCTDNNINIVRMAMLSLLAVFKDIIPGYRIRLPTEKELEMQVSKEVKRLREFEAKLLKCYQKYIQFLVRSLKSHDHQKSASRCVCGLLEAVPHFNYHDSLLSVVIPMMDSQDSECRKMSFDSVKSLFKNEGKHGGGATVEAVEMIAELVKSEKCILHPEVVQVLLELSLDEDLTKPNHDDENTKGREADSEKLDVTKPGKEKKAKKRQLAAKLRDEVMADFRESCALPDKAERRRLQTQTLTALFETYFRILKASIDPGQGLEDLTTNGVRSKLSQYGPRPLLRPCLDGLAKFSHLVSVDFMSDLLAILKKLAAGTSASGTDPPNFTDRLHCCVVAFKIVRSNLDALNIDLHEFYVSLYNLLLCHTFMRDEHDSKVLAEALQVMLWESRQHDMQRVAAFVKRLTSESLHLCSAEAMAALVTVRHLLQRYKKCRNLLENDEGGGVAGGNLAVLQSDAADPDLSGALSSILWEVSLLSNHYHPDVAKLASQISNMTINSNEVSLATLGPKDAIVLYTTSKGGFHPTVQLPRKPAKRKVYGHALKSTIHDSYHEAQNCFDDNGKMFSSHFKVLREIKENETLRAELSKVVRSLGLYEKYKNSSNKKTKSSKRLV